MLGFFGLSTLPVDYLPDITYPMVKIHIYWRGATPEEIDDEHLRPPGAGDGDHRSIGLPGVHDDRRGCTRFSLISATARTWMSPTRM
ncbi:MAG: hypothetical protein MZV63_25935 [Marinilabiliales bacterium]|nr:hypothetical protein [Marinilabiliales bacterium]